METGWGDIFEENEKGSEGGKLTKKIRESGKCE
jgi:hypothetical protein